MMKPDELPEKLKTKVSNTSHAMTGALPDVGPSSWFGGPLEGNTFILTELKFVKLNI